MPEPISSSAATSTLTGLALLSLFGWLASRRESPGG